MPAHGLLAQKSWLTADVHLNKQTMSIEEQIKLTIAEALDVDVSVITPELGINDIPEWNSIGNLAIIAAIEEKIGVEIPMEDLFDLTNVNSIIDEVKNLKK